MESRQALAERLAGIGDDGHALQQLLDATPAAERRAMVPRLLETLEETGTPLAPVVLRALGQLDRRGMLEALARPDLYPGVLNHRDFFLRWLTSKHAPECVEMLAGGGAEAMPLSEDARRALLERGAASLWSPLVESLLAASDAARIEPLAAAAEALLDADRATELAASCQKLAVPPPALLAALEKLFNAACVRFSLDPRTVATRTVRKTGSSPTLRPATSPDRSSPGLKRPAPPPAQADWQPLRLGVGLVLVAVVAWFAVPASPDAGTPSAAGSAAAHAAKKPVSLVGETGETIAFTGQVTRLDAARHSANVVGPGAVQVELHAADALPAGVQTGQRVRITGTISDVKSRKEIALSATRVAPGQ